MAARRFVRQAFGSVRARATLASLAVVGAAMGGGALGLIGLLRGSMTEGVETSARAQLNDVSTLMHLGQLPRRLPAGRGDVFVQVVGPGGRVLASSGSLLSVRPMSEHAPGEEGLVVRTVPTLSGREASADSDGPYLLLSQVLPAGAAKLAVRGPVTVYVAGSLHPVEEATATVALLLAVGLPLLELLVGLLVWTFAGRALRPVEAIRAEVADISGHDLHRRVPEPASADEVARLARTMNEMLDRLEASAEAQRRFVSDASHELRSPLAVLQATLEVALADPEEASWPSVAADALDEARRLHRLVEDLLELAKAGEAGAVGRRGPVDLDEIVFREARRWRASGTPVALDLRGVSAGRVLGDQDQLARAVHNLIDNAERHAASRVGIDLTSEAGEVILVVADDGPGIAPEDRERVFERFARLDEARAEDGGGAGLGLAIAREIVAGHGGWLEVLDSDKGARLAMRLPALE